MTGCKKELCQRYQQRSTQMDPTALAGLAAFCSEVLEAYPGVKCGDELVSEAVNNIPEPSSPPDDKEGSNE